MKSIAVVLVVLGIAMLVGAATGLPDKINDIVRHYKVAGHKCDHLGDKATNRYGQALVCASRPPTFELRWEVR